jgi:hypothetical protein
MDVMEKILISEDADLFEAVCRDLLSFLPVLNQLKDAYEQLDLGPLDSDVWKELRDSGHELVIARYNEALETELASTGVKNRVLRGVVLAGTGEPVAHLAKRLRAAKAFKPNEHTVRNVKLSLEHISYIDGKFIISDDDSEQIKERYCRTYLESEGEVELFQSLTKARDSYLELVEWNNKLSLDIPMGRTFGVFDRFFSKIGPNLTIDAGSVKGAFTYAERRKRSGY